MKDLRVKVAVVTGAGPGIGRALAVILAERGSILALADVFLAGLSQTREQVTKIGAVCSTHVVDVANGSLSVLIPNPRDLDGLINSMKEEPFTSFAGVNTLFTSLLHHLEFDDIDFSHLRWTIGGEAVKLFVVTNNKDLSSGELRRFCREQLTAYKVPKYVEFRDELPKSNVGKILRRELRDQ